VHRSPTPEIGKLLASQVPIVAGTFQVRPPGRESCSSCLGGVLHFVRQPGFFGKLAARMIGCRRNSRGRTYLPGRTDFDSMSGPPYLDHVPVAGPRWSHCIDGPIRLPWSLFCQSRGGKLRVGRHVAQPGTRLPLHTGDSVCRTMDPRQCSVRQWNSIEESHIARMSAVEHCRSNNTTDGILVRALFQDKRPKLIIDNHR